MTVHTRMKIQTIYLPKYYIAALSRIVAQGLYPSRSAAIREYVNHFIAEEEIFLCDLPKLGTKEPTMVYTDRCITANLPREMKFYLESNCGGNEGQIITINLGQTIITRIHSICGDNDEKVYTSVSEFLRAAINRGLKLELRLREKTKENHDMALIMEREILENQKTIVQVPISDKPGEYKIYRIIQKVHS